MAGERETSPQNKQILKRLLADPGNKTCADCKTATHPRWASWNLGIFLCIRCSGVHRSLGTHISKVRSVDLDSWTDMHLEQMIKWGNRKANMYWESKLGPNYVPDSSKIVNFIKTKYDLKRWVSAPVIPDPASFDSLAHPSEDIPLSQVKQTLGPAPSGNKTKANDLLGFYDTNTLSTRSTPAPASVAPVSLLDFDSPAAVSQPSRPSRATASRTERPNPVTRVATSKTGPLLTKAYAVPGRLDPSSTTPELAANVSATSNPANPVPVPSQRVDLKKSILSLYAQKPKSSPQAAAPVSQQPIVDANFSATSSAPAEFTDSSFGEWSSPSKPLQTPSLVDSLAGLTFQPSEPVSKGSENNKTTGVMQLPSNVLLTGSATSRETPQEDPSVLTEAESSDIFANVWR